MLLDSTFASELGTPQAAQTLAFVKKVLAGLLFVDIQVAGSTFTCQVKTGDGQNKTGVQNIMIRVAATDNSVPPALPIRAAISVGVGTSKAGSGTNIFWVQTNSAGALTVTVSGVTTYLIEMTPNQGVAMSVGVS